MEKKEFKNEEGCFDLVASILAQTYTDYVDALKTIKKHRLTYLIVIEPKSKKLRAYKKLEIGYNARLRKEVLTPKDKAFITRFKKKTPPKKLTNKEKEIQRHYEHAVRDKNECELFYRSGKYKRFTLGKGIAGEEVIRTAKQKTSWVEVDPYKLNKYEKKI